MNLEPIIQNEINKKDKYILTHTHIYIYMESRKMVLMILFRGQQRRHRCKEQTYSHSAGGRGWDDLRE